MKKTTDGQRQDSRRRPAKAAAGARAAAPSASARAGSRKGAGARTAAARGCGEEEDIRRMEVKRVAPPRGRPRCTEGCGGQGPVLRTDHVPPPLFFGDSLHMEFGHRLRELSGNPGPADRPKHHVIEVREDRYQYGEIASVQVITEYKEQFSYWRYDFSEGYGAQLQLWFQDVDSTTLPAQPHAVVRGDFNHNFGGNIGQKRTLLVECSERLGNSRPSQKKYRPHRNDLLKHKGDKEFHIGKWRIVDADGSPSGFGGSLSTAAAKFTFMISVYH